MSSEKLNLHQRILKIANMAGVLQKTKEGYGYKYVPEEDIQAKVTAGLQKYGVMLYMSIVPGTINITPIHYEKYDPKLKGLKPINEIIVSAEVAYTWTSVDDPKDTITTNWAIVGQMEDAAQAFGAGLTYGNRYYLLKQLQLATSESDPDNYRAKQHAAENYEAEAAEKAAAEELAKHVKEVVAAGSKLIKEGMDKANMMAIVAKHNNGNGNPSGIKSIEICDAILEELKTIKVAKEAKKEVK